MYGKRRFARKSTSRRAGGTFGSRGRYALRKVGARFVTKRRVANRLARREIKYDDDYINMASWVEHGQAPTTVTNSGGGFVNYVLGGVVKTVGSDGTIVGSNGVAGRLPGEIYAPNCLTNVDSGTTASTRIGNVIQPRYIALRGVLTASRTNSIDDAEATVNQEAMDTGTMVGQVRFVRTSVKLYIIRDKNMNEKGFVEFTDVFAPPMQTGGGLAGPGQNPFLFMRKIDTISRYEILKEVEYQLDQDDPQKSFTMVIPLKGKAIRYNGAVSQMASKISESVPWFTGLNQVTTVANTYANIALRTSADAQSMTNGIYLLAVSHSTANDSIDSKFLSPQLVLSSRLTFED